MVSSVCRSSGERPPLSHAPAWRLDKTHTPSPPPPPWPPALHRRLRLSPSGRSFLFVCALRPPGCFLSRGGGRRARSTHCFGWGERPAAHYKQCPQAEAAEREHSKSVTAWGASRQTAKHAAPAFTLVCWTCARAKLPETKPPGAPLFQAHTCDHTAPLNPSDASPRQAHALSTHTALLRALLLSIPPAATRPLDSAPGAQQQPSHLRRFENYLIGLQRHPRLPAWAQCRRKRWWALCARAHPPP